MLVAHDHGIDTGNLGDVQARVLHGGGVRTAVQTAMQQRDHDVGTLGAQLGHVLGGGLHGALGIDLAFKVALVPIHDAGRGEADHAHLDWQGHALAIAAGGDDLALQDGVGLHQRLAGLAAVYVGQHGRVARTGTLLGGIHAVHVQATAQHLVQERQAIVELVIAQRTGIKAQCTHGLVHGQLLCARNGIDGGLIVGQCRALDGVAIVHKQRVGELLARGAHQRGRALEAVALVLGELEIVVAAHVEVQVRRLQHRQRGSRALAGGVVAAAATGSQRDRAGKRGQPQAVGNQKVMVKRSVEHANRPVMV